MITKEQLQAMSDFEVNKALALLVMLVLQKETWTFNDNKNTVQFFNEDTKKSRIVDYCNTPNDIMSLAFEHGVSFLNAGNGLMFTATNNYELLCDKRLSDPEFKEAGGIYFIDVEPLRAIACCLILVLQEKQNERQIQTDL